MIETSENSDGEWATGQYRRPTEVYAFYGQATYPISDRFRLTGGIRYTRDRRQMAYELGDADVTEDDLALIDQYGLDTANLTELADGTLQYASGVIEYEDNQDNITYKGGVEFDITDASMLYLSVTTGYKAGGLNLQSAPFVTDYDPEELVSYSIGSKNRFMDNRLQVNAEAYYYDYDGYQVQIMSFDVDALTGGMKMVNATYNAETGFNMGLEVEVDYLLTSSDKVDFAVAFMDAEYGSIVLPSGPINSEELDLDGPRMANTPDYSGTIGYEHYWHLADGGYLTGRIEAKFSDGYWATHEQYLPGAWQDAYHMSNAYMTTASACG